MCLGRLRDVLVQFRGVSMIAGRQGKLVCNGFLLSFFNGWIVADFKSFFSAFDETTNLVCLAGGGSGPAVFSRNVNGNWAALPS